MPTWFQGQPPRSRDPCACERGGRRCKAPVHAATPLPSLPPRRLAPGARFQLLSFPSAHFPPVSSAILAPKERLHVVPVLRFFVPGGTSRFLQLFGEAWPFHLLYSHRTSLSSHNLTISRDPELQLEWASRSLPALWPLHPDSHCWLKYFPCVPLNFPAPSSFFNFNLAEVLFNPTLHSRIQFVWKMLYKIKFYCIIC